MSSLDESEYAQLRQYLVERARSVDLGGLAEEFFFVDRYTDRPTRLRIIEFLDVFRNQVALGDDVTVRQTVRRLDRVVVGGVDGIQVAVPPQGPQSQEQFVDLGTSVQMQEVLRQIDELRQALVDDASEE